MQEILDDDIHEVDFSDDDTREELKTFVGDKFEYFFSKWIMFDNGKWVSFNLAAFFLGMIWFLYRKMYLEAVVIFGCLLLEGFLMELIFEEGTTIYIIVDSITTIVYSLLICVSANYLYMKSAERKIAKLKDKGYSKEELLMRIEQKGGTSMASVLLVIAILILFAVVVSSYLY